MRRSLPVNRRYGATWKDRGFCGSTFLGQQENLAIFNAKRDQAVRTPVNLLTSEDLLVKAKRTLQILDPKLRFQDTVDSRHG